METRNPGLAFGTTRARGHRPSPSSLQTVVVFLKFLTIRETGQRERTMLVLQYCIFFSQRWGRKEGLGRTQPFSLNARGEESVAYPPATAQEPPSLLFTHTPPLAAPAAPSLQLRPSLLPQVSRATCTQFSSDRRMAKDEEFKLVKIQVRLSLSAWGARVRAEQLLLFEDSPRRLRRREGRLHRAPKQPPLPTISGLRRSGA
jgi:hypothetical protein